MPRPARLLLRLLVAALVAWAAPAARATEIVVTTFDDDFTDNGNCSLREAIDSARASMRRDACATGSGRDTIRLAAGTYRITRTGPLGGTFRFANETDVTVQGAGAGATIIDGSGLAAVVSVRSLFYAHANDWTQVTVTLRGLTLRGGEGADGGGGGLSISGRGAVVTAVECEFTGNRARSGGGIGVLDSAKFVLERSIVSGNTGAEGGGIYFAGEGTIRSSAITENVASGAGGGVSNTGTLAIVGSSIAGNRAAAAGGVENGGGLRIVNSTISGNTSTSDAGGLRNNAEAATLTLSAVTVSDNQAATTAGGIRSALGTTRLHSSIVAGNRATSSAPDVAGAFTSAGFNLVGVADTATWSGSGDARGTVAAPLDAKLAALAITRGSLATHLPRTGSPALAKGACNDIDAVWLVTDQRGVARPFVGCDVGAHEAWEDQTRVLVSEEPAGEMCVRGGRRIVLGVDENLTGALEAHELEAPMFACNGSDGASGANGANGTNGSDGTDGQPGPDGAQGRDALVVVRDEAPGWVCANGGSRIDTGPDANGDRVLGTDEVTGVSFACHAGAAAPGAAGARGSNALVDVKSELPGTACPEGGRRIRAGIDLDGNGKLGTDEVERTFVACHAATGARGATGPTGPSGHDALVLVVAEPKGADCAGGGHRINSGRDIDRDSILDAEEIEATAFLCLPSRGARGADALVNAEDVAAGATCPAGGRRLSAGLDDDGDGILDPDEIDSSQLLCHAREGTATLARFASEPPGANCAHGGQRLESGGDDDGDGALDDAEVEAVSFVCAGGPGNPGSAGPAAGCATAPAGALAVGLLALAARRRRRIS